MAMRIILAALSLIVLGSLAGCQWTARGVESSISIRSGAGLLTSEPLASKACLWITGLTNYHTIVTLVLAYDKTALGECLAHTPPVPGPPPRPQ